MIITLGHRQLMAVRDAGTDRHREYVGRAEAHGKNTHAVNMPAVAWRALLDPLTERAYNRFGEWSSKKPGYGSALRRIQASLLALEMHPAFVYGVQIGTQPTPPILVGFHRYGEVSPYPNEGKLVVLDPAPQVISVDVGGGPVDVDGVLWRRRLPHLGHEKTGLWVDPEDHEGWG